MDSNKQSAYEVGHLVGASDIDADLQSAMYLYLRNDLGLSVAAACDRANAELRRVIPQIVISQLFDRGISVRGRSVLDLGAGLGAMSEELVIRGATTYAIEPGESWANLAERRVARHHGQFSLRRARGESLPFDDDSMDIVISLQVLEHVQDPRAVMFEVARVLRPGGFFLLACENYLSFREGHYRIFWLPLLPKPLGSVYLRIRRRSPKFLMESVTYVTFPQILRWSKALDWTRCGDTDLLRRIDRSSGVPGKVMRSATAATGGAAPRIADRARKVFKFGVWELFQSPSASHENSPA